MAVPPILHTIWVGGTPPSYLDAHARRWLELHPGWEWRHWSEPEIDRFGLDHRDLYDDPERFSPKSHPGQYRSNIARYEILWRHGGVYLDADMEPCQPVGHLLDGRLVAGWERQDRAINNAFLASPSAHPALTAILDGLRDSILSQPRRRSTWQSGVHYITPILAGRNDVHILDQQLVYPYSWRDLDRGSDNFPGALMVHHWSNMRRIKGKPLG